VGLHQRYAEILGNDISVYSLCLSKKEEEIDAIAKKWASVLSDKIAREKAEEAARIMLRHGITDLPQLKETGRIGKRVVAQFFSGDTPRIEVNKKLTADDWARNTRVVQTGWSTQDNPILHECGHYVDYICNKEKYEKRSENSRFFGDAKLLLENKVSKYAATNQWELEAELYAGIMRGKVYPNDVLSLSRISKSDNDITKRILSYASGDSVCLPSEEISKGFKDAMKAVFNQNGSSFSIDIMADGNVQNLIEAHTDVLNRNIERLEMSDLMRQRLTRSNYIFSGLKTFHELNEAFPSLLDENGNKKTFERFLNDVRKIDETYNSNYLRAEYNFVQASAEMAAKWEKFMEDGDHYYLQYRTQHDDKVRPEHASLDRVTLPPSDSFWESYYPPNGWNCRCTVVQVLKRKYEPTPHDEAMSLGEEALQTDKKGIFRFNSGKEQKTFPDYNPYTIKRCRDCDIAKGKLNLGFVPENELCAACKLVHKCQDLKGCVPDEIYGNRLLISKQADQSEIVPNTRAARALVSSFPDMTMQIRKDVVGFQVKNPEYLINGMIADRKGILSPNGVASGFNKAIKQGCSAVVIDLDMHPENFKELQTIKMASAINNRHMDFENGTIQECYVVFNGKAVRITANHFVSDTKQTKENIKIELDKIKGDRTPP
jgi:SPP1 gp7 family putative phage head morphogenesis protein